MSGEPARKSVEIMNNFIHKCSSWLSKSLYERWCISPYINRDTVWEKTRCNIRLSKNTCDLVFEMIYTLTKQFIR